MTPERHARLTALFGEAIELGAAARAALVARVRIDDPPLADELAGLLAADAAADGLATGGLAPTLHDAPRARAAAGTAPAPPAPRATDASAAITAAPGRPRLAIPGFRVVAVLGEGSAGTVFAGEQDAPRRPVAIKVLHTASPAGLRRFRAEAEIMARLDHPGIARVLEAGEADGHPYLIMEQVRGVALDAHLRARQPPLDERLRLMVELCDAIHHAHVKGVIHRDLKPSNVMVREDGRVAVLDFGVARVAGGSGGDATRAGELVGTPIYMSPEQARLRPDEVDARSDVYALGVMLYEVASGELPYDVRGKALPDVARAICDDPPRPLGRRDPALRGDLEAITARALAKAPEHRYPSVAALADDLRAHLAGATIAARAPGALEQLGRLARRRPGLAAAVAAAIAGGAVFAAIVTTLWLDARAARRLAERERAQVAAARDRLEARNNQLVLAQARAALRTDPAAALAALRTVTARDVDPAAAWAIADEALGRGAATASVHAHDGEGRWIERVPGTAAVVTAGYDGRVRWWDRGAAAPRELALLPGRAHVVRPSPDGARLAIGGDAGVLTIVEPGGAVVDAPAGLTGDVVRMAWSPDGQWLVAGDDRGAVWAWTRGGGGGRLDGPQAQIEALAWSADGRLVVAGDAAGTVWAWSSAAGPRAGEVVGTVDGEVVAVWTDGAEVAAVAASGTVSRWRELGDARVAAPPVVTAVPAKSGAFAPAGDVAVIGGVDGRVVAVRGDAVAVLGAHGAQVRGIAVARGGEVIASAADDASVRVWDRRGGVTRQLAGHAQRVRALDLAADGAELVTIDSGGEARRWDLAAMPATVLLGHAAAIARLAVSADGGELLSADATGAVWRWRLADGRGVRVGAVDGRVTGLGVTRGGVVAAAGDRVAFFDGAAGHGQAVGGAVLDLAVDAAGDRVAVATRPGPIALFAGDGAPLGTLPGHRGGTDAVAISPDGRLLASGGEDGAVRVWWLDVPARPPLVLGPAADDVRQVRFSPDGRWLVASGDDGQVRGWAVRGDVVPSTARVLATHRAAVVALELDPSGTAVVSIARDHSRQVSPLAGAAPAVAAAPDDLPWIAVRAPAPGYAIGRGDGAIVVRPAAPRSLAALHAWLASR